MTTAPIGWPLLPVPDEQGRLSYPKTLAESVRESIRLLLTVEPGSLLMHPAFGAGLEAYLQSPNTLTLRRRLRDDVLESLDRWEPRIEVDYVDVFEPDDDAGHLRVEIGYRLVRTGEPQSIGVTLDLEG